MQRATAFRLIISIAALIFVLKPFFGFRTLNRQFKPHISHSILAKSFTKRKPESLEEADEKVAWVHKVLTNPPLPLLVTLSFLLATILPFVFNTGLKVTRRTLSDLRASLYPAQPAYLLGGKLII